MMTKKTSSRQSERLTQKEFNSLRNYSCSNPSGLPIGKVWRRAKNYYRQTDDVQDWLHCRVVPDPGGQTGYVGIEIREIVLLDATEEMIRNRLYS